MAEKAFVGANMLALRSALRLRDSHSSFRLGRPGTTLDILAFCSYV